jgi:hypothetical protein
MDKPREIQELGFQYRFAFFVFRFAQNEKRKTQNDKMTFS